MTRWLNALRYFSFQPCQCIISAKEKRVKDKGNELTHAKSKVSSWRYVGVVNNTQHTIYDIYNI